MRCSSGSLPERFQALHIKLEMSSIPSMDRNRPILSVSVSIVLQKEMTTERLE